MWGWAVAVVADNGRLSDGEAEAQLGSCCRLSGMSGKCLKLCSFRITKKDVRAHSLPPFAKGPERLQILEAAVSGACQVQDAAIWGRCVSGGKSNSDCCTRSGAQVSDLFHTE